MQDVWNRSDHVNISFAVSGDSNVVKFKNEKQWKSHLLHLNSSKGCPAVSVLSWQKHIST